MAERRPVVGGYAPGNYQCRCATCGEMFIGDKRANQCLPCVGEITMEMRAEIERLRKALGTMIQYAEWQMREGPGHHPTLPSAVSAARAALAADTEKGAPEYRGGPADDELAEMRRDTEKGGEDG